jgi:hypothetical protein
VQRGTTPTSGPRLPLLNARLAPSSPLHSHRHSHLHYRVLICFVRCILASSALSIAVAYRSQIKSNSPPCPARHLKPGTGSFAVAWTSRPVATRLGTYSGLRQSNQQVPRSSLSPLHRSLVYFTLPARESVFGSSWETVCCAFTSHVCCCRIIPSSWRHARLQTDPSLIFPTHFCFWQITLQGSLLPV